MSTFFLEYWYYNIPNYILAALIYTVLGRALLGMFVPDQWDNYIWKAFRNITNPVMYAAHLITPSAVPARRMPPPWLEHSCSMSFVAVSEMSKATVKISMPAALIFSQTANVFAFAVVTSDPLCWGYVAEAVLAPSDISTRYLRCEEPPTNGALADSARQPHMRPAGM